MKICPICRKVVPDDHKHYEQPQRKTTAQRGYGSKWQTKSKRALDRCPLCLDCLDNGQTTLATDCHVPKYLRGKDNKERHELVSIDDIIPLCHECHSQRTKRGE